MPSPVHRFEESIGGRPYLIEVAPVSDDRWRAYIVRLPGVPTALMPFYGATPVEAAEIANHGSAVVVGKLGTATVSRDELKAGFRDDES